MIAKQTVLILGAGASVDYKFPTGRQLLLQICEQAQRSGGLHSFFADRVEIASQVIEQFVQALQRSQAPSVDLFLENRPQFEGIGKQMIAASLIPREDYNTFRPSLKPRWYELLFQLMIDGSKFEQNRLAIITFNYDRSLEAFFFLALQNLYGLDETAAKALVNTVPIIHVYGSLGPELYTTADERDRFHGMYPPNFNEGTHLISGKGPTRFQVFPFVL